MHAHNCIAEIFSGSKLCGNVSRLLRRNFEASIFAEQMCDALTTPIPVDGHIHMQSEETRQRTTKWRSILVQQWPSLPFVWRPAPVVPNKKTHPAVKILRSSLFKPLGCLPLKCLPQTRTARINDGHASYFTEVPCFLTPKHWSSSANC